MAQQTEANELIPAQVFSVAEIIAMESIARDWSLHGFAERIAGRDDPTHLAMTILEYEMLAACAETGDVILSADAPDDLARVFGTSAEFWRNTEATCRRFKDRIAPLEKPIRDWYGLDDEVPDSVASTPTGN